VEVTLMKHWSPRRLTFT